ncbi:MAG TPA: AraC family transcriptional regulator [Clostridiales bacterium]|nr:AraC family transcriptional regulator [Clostridiales bacterium]
MNTDHNSSYGKTGYLTEEFRLVHLKDKLNVKYDFHYHEFNKIIIFLSGDVTYLIEGKPYKLQPWDILLVSSNEVHRPVINPEILYDRVVIWTNESFLDKHSNNEYDLSACFKDAEKMQRNLIRLDPAQISKTQLILSWLEDACKRDQPGGHILKNAIFIQLLVRINDQFSEGGAQPQDDLDRDTTVQSVITYINENIKSDLSIDSIASNLFVSKYYLMHKFKERTGYTIYNYILQKRILLAGTLIKKGVPMMQASYECGFNDYSCFVRAFKKIYGVSPKKYFKQFKKPDEFKEDKHFV